MVTWADTQAEDAVCDRCQHFMDWHWWDGQRTVYVCRDCGCALHPWTEGGGSQ